MYALDYYFYSLRTTSMSNLKQTTHDVLSALIEAAETESQAALIRVAAVAAGQMWECQQCTEVNHAIHEVCECGASQPMPLYKAFDASRLTHAAAQVVAVTLHAHWLDIDRNGGVRGQALKSVIEADVEEVCMVLKRWASSRVNGIG